MTDTNKADSRGLWKEGQHTKPNGDFEAPHQLVNTIGRIDGDENGSDARTCPL